MSRLGYTNEDFLNLIIIYGECHRILDRTCRVFAERYPERPAPNRNLINRLLHNCREFGSFTHKVIKKSPVVDDEDAAITVLGYFSAYPKNSVSDAERDLRYAKSTVHRILVKHNWHPFKYNHVQFLNDGDLAIRINYCEWLMTRIQEDELFLKNIIWTDEAKFSKNGIQNRHNSHFWASENPNVTRERNFQLSWSFNVYCAIKDNRILCIYFYDNNLTGANYLWLLNNVVTAALRHLPEQEVQNCFYQMDGAPPHNTHAVRTALEELFRGQWIAHNGPYRYPPRSPDLTPLDYFFWGYIKNEVYADPITTKEDMQQRILAAVNNLSPAAIQRATSSQIQKRILACLHANGSVFEHLF